jgi:hypothetical protein
MLITSSLALASLCFAIVRSSQDNQAVLWREKAQQYADSTMKNDVLKIDSKSLDRMIQEAADLIFESSLPPYQQEHAISVDCKGFKVSLSDKIDRSTKDRFLNDNFDQLVKELEAMILFKKMVQCENGMFYKEAVEMIPLFAMGNFYLLKKNGGQYHAYQHWLLDSVKNQVELASLTSKETAILLKSLKEVDENFKVSASISCNYSAEMSCWWELAKCQSVGLRTDLFAEKIYLTAFKIAEAVESVEGGRKRVDTEFKVGKTKLIPKCGNLLECLDLIHHNIDRHCLETKPTWWGAYKFMLDKTSKIGMRYDNSTPVNWVVWRHIKKDVVDRFGFTHFERLKAVKRSSTMGHVAVGMMSLFVMGLKLAEIDKAALTADLVSVFMRERTFRADEATFKSQKQIWSRILNLPIVNSLQYRNNAAYFYWLPSPIISFILFNDTPPTTEELRIIKKILPNVDLDPETFIHGDKASIDMLYRQIYEQATILQENQIYEGIVKMRKSLRGKEKQPVSGSSVNRHIGGISNTSGGEQTQTFEQSKIIKKPLIVSLVLLVVVTLVTALVVIVVKMST